MVFSGEIGVDNGFWYTQIQKMRKIVKHAKMPICHKLFIFTIILSLNCKTPNPVESGIFYGCSETRFSSVTDGLSNTFFIGEAPTDYTFAKDGCGMDHWYIGCPQADSFNGSATANAAETCGGNDFSEIIGSTYPALNALFVEPTLHGYQMQLAFGSYHPNGANFLFGDGSVRFFPNSITKEVYQGLSSRNGKETVGF